MLEIDGSRGEGGGQLLRNAVALAALTGSPVRLRSIRAKRATPGLAPQHLAAVRAVAALCGARVEGLALRSRQITFVPGPVRGGEFAFDVGTAGSVTLVLQALLPVMIAARVSFRVRVSGGTDVRGAPPLDYLDEVVLPLLSRMGARVRLGARLRGYYPRGGGAVEAEIAPGALRPLDLGAAGTLLRIDGLAHVARLPAGIAQRMAGAALRALGPRAAPARCRAAALGEEQAAGPGGAVVMWAQCERTVLGAGRVAERGLRAEALGEAVGGELAADLAAGATLDVHAADQMLVYLALAAGESSFATRELTGHAQTAMWLIGQFLPARFAAAPRGALTHVAVTPRPARCRSGARPQTAAECERDRGPGGRKAMAKGSSEQLPQPLAGAGSADAVLAAVRDRVAGRDAHEPARLPENCRIEAPIAGKVAFLRRPDAYAPAPATVEVIETHLSWVFLAGEEVYKLKKPVRYDFLDFSTLEARRENCEREVLLNRRLAGDVYRGTVPLVARTDGGLQLGGDGTVVDWLVRMRRLPGSLMLDHAIRQGRVSREDIRRVTRALADFYRRSEPAAMTPREYRQRFARDVRANHRELALPQYGIAPGRLEALRAAQLRFLESGAGMLEQRARERRIVEGHGDLRPEHVYLGPEPLFIDCLEFNRDWRLIDPADELGYLAMECEHAGAADVGEAVLAAYREAAGDDPPPALLDFYRSCRATLRAKLSVWHLADHPAPADRVKWTARAERYLDLANRYAASL